MTTPKEIGERSEAQVIAKFLQAGLVVLTPFGDSQRYDLVVDQDGRFIRVQCKTGKIVKGALRFPTCSNNWRTGKTKNYRGDVEFFAVYSPELDAVYVVPVGDVGTKLGFLRIAPPGNNQVKRIRLASDYEFRGSVL